MTHIVLLSDSTTRAADVVPALELLDHAMTSRGLDASSGQLREDAPEIILLDARTELVRARNAARLLRASDLAAPIVAVLTESALAAVTQQWPIDDFIFPEAGPAEFEARCRLLARVVAGPSGEDEAETFIRCGAVVIDEAAYTARIGHQMLNLTYKEFELLKFMAQNAGRVFTRGQLLSEVWGYDYYGGTRTVDVHIRRLRAKLGADHEQMITTVRNVGYSLTDSGEGRGPHRRPPEDG